jgi:hypothetical protein
MIECNALGRSVSAFLPSMTNSINLPAQIVIDKGQLS